MGTAEDPAYPIGEFVSAQQTLGLYNLALAVDPFGFDGVEPRTLLWQKAAHDPHPSFVATVFDFAVVLAEPAPDLFGDMPACVVVPDEKQDFLTDRFELLSAPSQKLSPAC